MNLLSLLDRILESSQKYSKDFQSISGINTCINPYSYHLVRLNGSIYGQFDGIYVDGISMCWLLRLLWGIKVLRRSFDMSSMANDLFTYLNEPSNNKTIFFVGAKEDCLQKSIFHFQNNFPDMKIIGYRNGYFFNEDDRQNTINEIVTYKSDFTIIGMGALIQEKFAIDLKNAGYNGVIFTCGGFLHQSADNINYYPKWINRYNLRAFYRLFHEKGLWGRLYNVLIEFPILFTYDTIKSKIKIRK